MSDPSDRRSNRTQRRIVEELAAAQLRGEFLELEYLRMRERLDGMKLTWRLATAPVQPDQQYDTRLHEPERGDNFLTKAASTMARYHGRIRRVERQPYRTIVTATIDCAGMSAAALKRAFAKADDVALDQMMNRTLAAAGVVLESVVGADSRVELRCAVTDRTAAEKAAHSVYSGVVLDIDDGEIDQISLVDTPVGFMKAAGADNVICKVYQRSRTVKKQSKKDKELRKRAELANFTVNHRMTGKDPELDLAVFKTLHSAAPSVAQQPGVPVASALGLLTSR